MPYAKGAILSRPDPRDFHFDAQHYGAPAIGDLPPAVDLRGGNAPTRAKPAGPVRDQGQEGSCVGHAATELREALRVAAGASFVRYSPAFTYYLARLAEGTQSEDAGCMPRDALDSMLHAGTCPEAVDPYVAGAFAVAPTADQYGDAKYWRIGSYHQIGSFAEYQQACAAGAPCMLTIPVNQAFEDTSNGYITDPTALSYREFNHEVLGVGYDQQWILCQNSWGTGWGDQGYFYLPASCWQAGFIGEAWTASLKLVA